MKRILFIAAVSIIFLNADAQLPGNSMQLKADYNYVTVPDASSLIPNNTMTIEAWIYYKCENGATGNMIMSKGWCGTPDWTFYFNIVAQKLRFAKWRNGYNTCSGNQALYETTDEVIPFNEWVHVAVTLTAANVVTFYVNGEAQGSSLISGTDGAGFNASNFPILIGTSRSLANIYNSLIGNIDEVRVWHTARTQAELQANMNTELTGSEAGLYTYWKLNESGNGPGISVINSATATAGTFNGNTVGTAANIRFTNNDTVINGMPLCDPVLWLKADSAVTYNGSNQVSQWNDVSGLNNHVAQAAVANRPVFQNNVINAKPGIYFDGANGKYFLNNTTNNLVNSGLARTVFVAARRDCNTHLSGLVGGTLFTFRRSGLINTLSYGANTYGTPVYIYSDNNGIGNNNATIGSNTIDTASRNFVITYKVPAAGNQIQCNLNSMAQVVNQGAGSVTAETGTTGFTVGDREDQPDLDWSGWIYETIVFNRALLPNEINSVQKYLKTKYPQTPNIFNALYTTAQNYNNGIMNDGTWEHSYNTAELNKVIASINSNCLDLGTRSDTVYAEPTAGLYNGSRYMRRHYVVNTAFNPAGNKRVRLYYTKADFADLQSYVPALTSHTQLCVTKYDGPGEDGIYDPTGGTAILIPSNQITTGTAFGQRFLEFDVAGFSEFWIHTMNIPLPLELLSFTASKEANAAVLNWKTANMKNVSGFEIEKSNDAISFSKIGFVAATEKTEYSFTDNKLADRNNYYRLKMKDPDEQFSYSKTALVLNTDNTEITLYPNPVKDGLNIMSSANNFSYQIYDVYGKEIISGISINNNKTISCVSLNKGVYFIKVQSAGEIKALKFIKE